MALGPIASLLAAGGFFVVDLSFLTANMTKVLQGGYIPLLLAAAVYTVMLIWHRGCWRPRAPSVKRQCR